MPIGVPPSEEPVIVIPKHVAVHHSKTAGLTPCIPTRIPKWDQDECLAEYDAVSRKLKVTYRSGPKWYRINFAKKSINNTFTILGFGYSDAYDASGNPVSVESAEWAAMQESEGDWLSPVVVEAVEQSDRSALMIYTSGSHGTSNGEGNPTAVSLAVDIYIDGVLLDFTTSYRSACRQIEIRTLNKVLAWNTIASARPVLEEFFTYVVTAKGVHLHKKAQALENVRIAADNGCQMYMVGITPITACTYLMFGSQQTARTTFDNLPFDSGAKSMFPSVYGVSVRHHNAGEFAAWIDVNYGAGNRDNIAPNEPLYDFPRANGKLYPRLFSGSNPLALSDGEFYEWRGGYYWGAPTETEAFDTVLAVQAGMLYVKANGSYSIEDGS